MGSFVAVTAWLMGKTPDDCLKLFGVLIRQFIPFLGGDWGPIYAEFCPFLNPPLGPLGGREGGGG